MQLTNRFTDVLAALEEADWLAERTLEPYAVVDCFGDYAVTPYYDNPPYRVLEVVRP